MSRIAVVVAFALLSALPALAAGDVNTQWKRRAGNEANLSLVELVRRGYEVKATQQSRFGTWVYLQKNTSVFRCNDEVQEVGSGLVTCLELVDPYKFDIK